MPNPKRRHSKQRTAKAPQPRFSRPQQQQRLPELRRAQTEPSRLPQVRRVQGTRGHREVRRSELSLSVPVMHRVGTQYGNSGAISASVQVKLTMPVEIVVDAMGSDKAPESEIRGAILACSTLDVKVALAGPKISCVRRSKLRCNRSAEHAAAGVVSYSHCARIRVDHDGRQGRAGGPVQA